MDKKLKKITYEDYIKDRPYNAEPTSRFCFLKGKLLQFYLSKTVYLNPVGDLAGYWVEVEGQV